MAVVIGVGLIILEIVFEDYIDGKRKLEINEENVRLDKFVMQEMPDLSRTLIQEYIKEGHILVNGKNEKASYKIKMNDDIEVTILIIRIWMFYQKIFL